MSIYEQFNIRKISMAAILKSAPKNGGGPTYKALTSRLLISGVPEQNDVTHGGSWGGGGCTVTPLGPWTMVAKLLWLSEHKRQQEVFLTG